MPESEVCCGESSCQSAYVRFGRGPVNWPVALRRSLMRTSTSACGSATGSDRSVTALSSWKIALLAPIPNASVMIATAVTPQLRRRARNPYLTSCQRVPNATPPPPPPGTLGSGSAGRSVCANARVKTSLLSSAAHAPRSASASAAPAARSSRYRSSRSSTSSSTISFSRCTDSRSGARRRRSSGFQSGTFCSHNPVDGGDEGLPAAALLGQDAAARRREAITAAAALVRPFDPAALNPAALLEAVEQRIQRRNIEAHRSPGSALDELRDVVAVSRAGLHERQDQQLGAAFFHFPIENPACMSHRNIC